MPHNMNEETIAETAKVIDKISELRSKQSVLTIIIEIKEKELEEVNRNINKLDMELNERLRRHDVHTSQTGNTGYEGRVDYFLTELVRQSKKLGMPVKIPPEAI